MAVLSCFGIYPWNIKYYFVKYYLAINSIEVNVKYSKVLYKSASHKLTQYLGGKGKIFLGLVCLTNASKLGINIIGQETSNLHAKYICMPMSFRT